MIANALKSIKNDSLGVFLKKAYNYVLVRITPLLLPLLIARLKCFNGKGTESTFDFSSNFLNGLIAPLQIKNEFVSLMDLVEKNKPKVVVEIGTAKGGTLFCFTRVLPHDSLIISLDLPGGEFGGGYPVWKKFLYGSFAISAQKIRLLRLNSHDKTSFDELAKILNGRKIDFLFIDADHTYEGVKKDYELYSPLVGDGGIIAMHDIVKTEAGDKCEVEKFWSEIKNNYKFQEYIASNDQKNSGIGVIFK